MLASARVSGPRVYADTLPQIFTAERVHEIFHKMSDEDVRTLGLNPQQARPDWMVLTVFPIPPPHVRPSVMSDTGRSEDDLTHKLAEIIRANTNLRRQMQNGAPQHRARASPVVRQPAPS